MKKMTRTTLKRGSEAESTKSHLTKTAIRTLYKLHLKARATSNSMYHDRHHKWQCFLRILMYWKRRVSKRKRVVKLKKDFTRVQTQLIWVNSPR